MVILMASFNQAKPRTVDLEKELNEASVICLAELMAYTDSTLLFKTENTQTTFSAKTYGKITPTGQTGDRYFTATWPLMGEKLLVVINHTGYISLFAKRIGNNYRFWSPAFTGSIALFTFNEPATCLPDEHGIDNQTNQARLTCWDGCIMPVSEIKERI